MNVNYLAGHCYTGDAIGIDRLAETLKGYDKTRPYPLKPDIQLRTDIQNLESGKKTASFYINADYVELIPYRNESQPVRRTASIQVRCVDEDDRATVICYGVGSSAAEAIKEIKRILGMNRMGLIHLQIPSQVIKNIVIGDSSRWIGGRWNDVDAKTKSASLSGDLDESAFKAAFEKAGKISSASFESNHLRHRTVSLASNGSVGVRGKVVNYPDVSDYFDMIVKPALKAFLSQP